MCENSSKKHIEIEKEEGIRRRTEGIDMIQFLS
jgi:hypothetical protein